MEGFNGAAIKLISKDCRAQPDYLIPCHCTGWKPTNRIIETILRNLYKVGWEHFSVLGLTTQIYLIHLMEGATKSWREFAQKDKIATYARAATENGVKRIIYLGFLSDPTYSSTTST